jgi:hypothetical protein
MNLAAFIRQKPDERLVLQIRRYWLTFVPTLIIFTILFVIGIFLYIVFLFLIYFFYSIFIINGVFIFFLI